MKKKQVKKMPYAERSDEVKIASNWKKVEGLINREEWSAAIVRAATACEIAANLAIRHELQSQRNLEESFVDNLLTWSNGLAGKLDRILLPLNPTGNKKTLLKSLKKSADKINKLRNQIAHSGHFMNESEAKEIVALAEIFVHKLVNQYVVNYEFTKAKRPKLKAR